MIIPVRCISCGKPVGQKWEEFKERKDKGEDLKVIMDDLGLERFCCRSQVMSHVDLIAAIKTFCTLKSKSTPSKY